MIRQIYLNSKANELRPFVSRNVFPQQKSGSVSLDILQEKAPNINEFYRSDTLLEFVSKLTNNYEEGQLDIQHDEDSMSMNFYSEEGRLLFGPFLS